LAQSPISELITYQYGEKLAGQPVSMIVASGPYTLDDDLLYAPLEALVDLAIDERPDVLILVGPAIGSDKQLNEVARPLCGLPTSDDCFRHPHPKCYRTF